LRAGHKGYYLAQGVNPAIRAAGTIYTTELAGKPLLGFFQLSLDGRDIFLELETSISGTVYSQRSMVYYAASHAGLHLLQISCL
jgi:hypothetical protein